VTIFLTVVLVTLTGFGSWTSIGPEGGDVDLPVVSPDDPLELWALSGSYPTSVVHSTDGGTTWETLVLFNGGDIRALTVCPNGDLVAASSGKSYTSTDGGESWATHSIPGVYFKTLEAHPTNSNLVYGSGFITSGGWKGVFIYSTDGGSSFTYEILPTVGSFNYIYANSIDISHSSPNTILVGGYGYAYKDSSDATSTPFVFKTTDGGATFTEVTPTDVTTDKNFNGVAIHPSNPDIMLAGSDRSMYRSVNGGTSWTKVAAVQTDNWEIRFSEADPNYVYAAGHSRIHRSTNAGQTWTTVTSGITGTRIYWIEPSWNSSSDVYIGSQHGFFLSNDWGENWTPSNTGLLVAEVLAMAESQGWIFMNVLDMGMYKTPSAGPIAWEVVSTPLNCGDFCDICADGSGVLMALEGAG